MRTRVCSAHFWSEADLLTIKHTDFAAFRYENKKSASSSVYREGKKMYVEKRGQRWSLPAKRPLKLKDRLRDLTELMKNHRLIHCTWKSCDWACLVFSVGTIVYVNVNASTGDIARILFDRYLIGKLTSTNISEVLFTDTHILLTYNDNQAILVNFNKPSLKSKIPEKLSKRDPKVQVVELVGGWRRGGRLISGSVGGGNALIWSRASPSDLFPWSPRAPNEEHANVHIYSLQGSQINLKHFHRIEFDPICVSFSKIHEKLIYSVEQKTSRKGGVIVECRQLEIGDTNELLESNIVRVAAPAPATCAARSPCETLLLLTCSDRSVLLHHYLHNITTTVTAAFVARTCCWWQDGSGPAVMVGGVGPQLQCWDAALAPIHLAPVTDSVQSSPVYDLTSYFRKEPIMTHLLWNSNSGTVDGNNGYITGDRILLAVMQDGPLVCVRIHAPVTFQGDEGGGGPVVFGAEAAAVSRLRTMDWVNQGTACLSLLHRIINNLFSRPLNIEVEDLAQAAIGTFLAPIKPLPSSVRLAHLPQLHDICRRFFYHLMRFGRLEKAFCLAIDVGHRDLFIDVKCAAEAIGADDLAVEANLHAEDALSSCESSSCSHLSCSNCSNSNDSSLEEDCVLNKTINNSNKKIDLYGPPISNTNSRPNMLKSPPPLPYIPISQNVFVKDVPPTNSLFPKSRLKSTYSEKEDFPWNDQEHPLDGMALSEGKVLHRVVEIIPQPVMKSQSALDLFQTELPENAAISDHTKYFDKMRIDVNPIKTESLINIYTPVYHQHRTLSGKIPSTVSALPTTPPSYLPLTNNKDLAQMSSQIGLESTLFERNNTKGRLLNPSLLWNTKLNTLSPPTVLSNKKILSPTYNVKSDILSSSLTHINKTDLTFSKPEKINGLLNNISKSAVIKSSSINSELDNNTSKPPGEKNKVKFSDTVTVAVVPEISRKERRIGDRISMGRNYSGSMLGHLDPQKELADSLPLCHPNHDYLKDFAPQPEPEEKEKQTKIKVVHFGVV